MSNPPHALDVTPETELTFNLSRSNENSRVTMTLHHPGNTDEHLAFKVRCGHCSLQLPGTRVLEYSALCTTGVYSIVSIAVDVHTRST